ncbi:MAG TPA: outer membrane beta-barrel protein, partial [Holophaga sp.]|nr:outer membrane beta-barrel protein [Holophaga sp.]
MRHSLLLLCLAALETPLAAGGALPEGWVQAKVALVKPDGCNCLKDSVGVGAGAGMWFGPRWGAEVDLLHLRLESSHSSAASDETHLLASGLFNLAPTAAPWVPYARAGLGLASIQSPFSLASHRTTRATYHAGLGAQRWWGDHRMFSAELRSVTIDNEARRTEFQGLLGLGLRWGGGGSSRPVPAAAPVAPAPASAP